MYANNGSVFECFVEVFFFFFLKNIMMWNKSASSFKCFIFGLFVILFYFCCFEVKNKRNLSNKANNFCMLMLFGGSFFKKIIYDILNVQGGSKSLINLALPVASLSFWFNRQAKWAEGGRGYLGKQKWPTTCESDRLQPCSWKML